MLAVDAFVLVVLYAIVRDSSMVHKVGEASFWNNVVCEGVVVRDDEVLLVSWERVDANNDRERNQDKRQMSELHFENRPSRE